MCVRIVCFIYSWPIMGNMYNTYTRVIIFMDSYDTFA